MMRTYRQERRNGATAREALATARYRAACRAFPLDITDGNDRSGDWERLDGYPDVTFRASIDWDDTASINDYEPWNADDDAFTYVYWHRARGASRAVAHDMTREARQRSEEDRARLAADGWVSVTVEGKSDITGHIGYASLGGVETDYVADAIIGNDMLAEAADAARSLYLG